MQMKDIMEGKHMPKIESNQIIVLRNGSIGVTASFNDKPFQLIFRSYTSMLSRYDENLKHKNPQYDIVCILDGSGIDDVRKVFSNKFSLDGIPIIWQED